MNTAFFQGLEPRHPIFSRPWKNSHSFFQGLEKIPLPFPSPGNPATKMAQPFRGSTFSSSVSVCSSHGEVPARQAQVLAGGLAGQQVLLPPRLAVARGHRMAVQEKRTAEAELVLAELRVDLVNP